MMVIKGMSGRNQMTERKQGYQDHGMLLHNQVETGFVFRESIMVYRRPPIINSK